ncbi:hypothetical protein RhiTH_010972 [Rhizoctonia solani]
MKPRTLNLDTTRNLVWLDCTVHKLFDHRHWALLPSEAILDEILRFVVQHIDYEDREKFTKVFPHQIYEYTFVQLKPCTEPYIRYDKPQVSVHQGPFSTLSPIRSHIHPYFVICNVALKDKKFYPHLKAGTQSEYETLAHDPSLLKRLRLCRSIFTLWDRPLPAHFDQLAPPDNLAPTVSSGHSTTSRNTTRSAKRRRVPDNHKGSTADVDDDASQGYEPTESALTRSLFTPGESQTPHNQLESTIGHTNPETPLYLLKVGTWLQGIKPSADVDNLVL